MHCSPYGWTKHGLLILIQSCPFVNLAHLSLYYLKLSDCYDLLLCAAETGEALSVVMRQQQPTSFSLPVALALELAPCPEGIQVTVTKRKGGSHGQPFTVNMAQAWPSLTQQPKSSNIVPLPRIHSLTG